MAPLCAGAMSTLLAAPKTNDFDTPPPTNKESV